MSSLPTGFKASIVCVGLLIATVAEPVGVQSDTERGRAVMDRAIVAAGGRETLARLDRWVVSGKGRENLSAEWQGREADKPTWRDHEETTAVAGGAVAWERRTPRNDLSLRWRRFIYGPEASGFIDWNAGFGRLAAPGTPIGARDAVARRIPHVLLRQIDQQDPAVRWLSERRLDDGLHDAIEVRFADTPALRLFISQRSSVLGRLEYDVFLPGIGDSVVSWTWRGWTPHAVLGSRPSRQVVAVGGTTFQEVAFTRYDGDAGGALSFVQLPADLKPTAMSMNTPPPAVPPASGEVAPGIHIRNVQGFNVMAVEGRDSITVVEAPEAARGLEAIPASNAGRAGRVALDQLAWLDSAFPRKPIRYLVVSHHHGDHIGGAPLFAARGATLLISPADFAAARRSLDSRYRLSPWPQAPSGATRKVESVRGRRVINDGARDIEIIDAGENPHTASNLFVWLPSERMLFQGDLFYFDEGGAFPPPGRETMNRFFARLLEQRGIRPRAIYGVHNNAAAGPDALEQMRRAR